MVKSYGWWVGGCPLAHVNCVFVSAPVQKVGFWEFSDLVRPLGQDTRSKLFWLHQELRVSLSQCL